MDKPPHVIVYPPPDFSVPPPAIQDSQKKFLAAKFVPGSGMKECKRYESPSLRDRDRRSPHGSSSRDSRDSSRYSSHSYSKRDERPRYSHSRRRSRSRSPTRSSVRRSPAPRHSSSRHNSRESSSRSHSRRRSPSKERRRSRDAPSSRSTSTKGPQTERERLLLKWRQNYCETSDQISKKLQELANDEAQVSWIRASPADIHYRRTKDNVVESTPRLDALCTLFEDELLKRSERTRETQAPYNAPNRRRKIRVCRHKSKS